MAYTERYVSALAGGGGDGSVGNPWTWDEARVACIPGTRVNVKADGTYSLLANEGTSTLHYMALYLGRPDAPICWRGYGTTPGDGVRVNINMGGVALMISPKESPYVNNRGCWSMMNFDITGTGQNVRDTVLFDDNDGSRTRPLLVNVRVYNTRSGTDADQAYAADLTGPIAINCLFSSAHLGTGSVKNVINGPDWLAIGCTFLAAGGVADLPYRGQFLRCLFVGGESAQTAISRPGSLSSVTPLFDHCVFDGFALAFDATSTSDDTGFVNVRNCIFRNCAKLFLDTSRAAYRHYFIYGNKVWNSSGTYDLFDFNSDGSDFGYASNDMWPFGTVDILADDPFVDAESGDYRVTSASGCIDTALPLRTQYGAVIGADIGMVEVVPEEDYPDEEDVRKDVAYKSGILTGTLVLPSTGDVRNGTDYDAPTAQQTGTCHVPAASDVRSGVDVDDTTGTCHVPAAADVRVDVDVDDTVGTCVVPDPEDVKRDVPVDATVGTFDARRDIVFKDESSVG